MKLCECGCGEAVIQKYTYYVPKFIKGHFHHTEETKGKMSEALKGQPWHGRKGWHHSDESKAKIGNANSISLKGKSHTEERKVKRRTHGHTKTRDDGLYRTTPEYNSWQAMKQRCSNPHNQDWKDYGGRGIKVCKRWLGKHGFENFLSDMGDRPEEMTLDRKGKSGNHESSNCRWATQKEQIKNRRHITSAQYIKLEKSFLFTLICLELAMRKGGKNVPNNSQ